MATAGPTFPGTAATRNIGRADWVNPTNATAEDGTFATITDAGSGSDCLVCSNMNWGFSAGTTVSNILIEVKGKVTVNADAGSETEVEGPGGVAESYGTVDSGALFTTTNAWHTTFNQAPSAGFSAVAIANTDLYCFRVFPQSGNLWSIDAVRVTLTYTPGNIVCLPTAASLTVSPATPAIKFGTNVLPTAASLALSMTTPAVVLAVKVLPTAANLAVTLSTPAVVVVTNTSALPTVASLVLTPSTPAVAFTANAYPQPSAASLTLSLATPAVLQATTILPSAATLSLSPSTPVVILGTNVLPSAATLTLTLSTPGVVLGTNVLPTAASLTLSLSTPDVAATTNTFLLPLALLLVLTLSTPSVYVPNLSDWPRPQPGVGRFYGPSVSNSARFVASKTGSGRFHGPQRGSGR